MNPSAGGCRDPWPRAVALVISETRGHMENLLHNHHPKLGSWPPETRGVTKVTGWQLGEERGFNNQSFWLDAIGRAEDGHQRSKVVFSVKGEWTPWHSARGMRSISGLLAAVVYLCRGEERLCWFSRVSEVTFNLRVIFSRKAAQPFPHRTWNRFVDGGFAGRCNTSGTAEPLTKLAWIKLSYFHMELKLV